MDSISHLLELKKDAREINQPHPFGEPFYFIQAADCQFGLIDRYLKKLEVPGWEEERASTEQLIAACNKLQGSKPKFLVICGDLVDAYPGEPIREKQVSDLKSELSKLDSEIPLVCVCGNHDIGNEPTLEGLEQYKREFGEDYFYFVVENVLFIVLNSQFYEHRENLKDYASDQDKWLELMLEKCKLFKHSIVFQHIPWFINNSLEDDQYFNINKEVRSVWLQKFKLAGVSKIMCGHYHQNAGGWYDEDLELVVTSAIGAQLGADKSGARIVKVLENSIEHKYYEMSEIPTKVDLN